MRPIRIFILALAAAGVAVFAYAGVALASPGSLVVDRGLPTENLNNAAGSNRSNVAWSNGNEYVSGDNFTIGSAGQTWVINQIRDWSIAGTPNSSFNLGDRYSDVTLYFGTGAIVPIATGTLSPGSSTNSNPNITHTPTTYAGGANYQTTSGPYAQIWQNDFTNLGQVVQGGQLYYFAVDGTPREPSSFYWFNQASNAALSGSPQQGADNHWNAWGKLNLTTLNSCDSGAPSGGVCDGGWDKSSDINVQVLASQVVTNKDLCKQGGWQTLVRLDGTGFKNQGDCVSYVATGGRH